MMSGVSAEAPIGVQFIQKLTTIFCPRLHFNRLRCYQASVLVLTYFTYVTYHLTRKPISVVKTVLHRNCSELPLPPDVSPADDQWCNWAPFNTSDANTLLGTMDAAFLFSYAGAMFVSGMIAERVDLRYFLSLGMIISGIFCYLFGLAKTYGIHHLSYYLLVQIGAGIAQTTGWPGTVAIVGKWFGNSKKGLIFGIWNSHTSLGNILGTLMATEYVEYDWALSFIYPGLVMGSAGLFVWLFLVPEPAQVGLSLNRRRSMSDSDRRSISDDGNMSSSSSSPIMSGDQVPNLRSNRHSTNSVIVCTDSESMDERTSLLRPSGASSEAVSLTRALTIPGVLEYSLSLFFAKLVSYTFLYWLPLYISTSTRLDAKRSGDLSTAFDLGGIMGAALAGLLADCANCPAIVCLGFYTLSVPALFVYQMWGTVSYSLNMFLLIVSGLLVNGPYALITTAVSADLGTHSSLAGNSQALATVTAIIDGTGSIGAALGPMLAGVVSSAGNWSHVFYMLILCNIMALLLLVRLAKSEVQKMRHDRRMAINRSVRIE